MKYNKVNRKLVSFYVTTATVLAFVLLVGRAVAIDKIPEEFVASDQLSKLEISYDDYTQLLKFSVLDSGRSLRENAPRTSAKIGSRLKANRSVYTALEGNRFNYDNFRDDENIEVITRIRKSLEQVPSEVPLSMLSNNEQLAFWLNLYNIALIEQVALAYPMTKLEDFLYDEDDGILNKKILKVAGYALSLDDIQFKIVYQKFPHPQVMYGFFQSIIGGPNIRREAYNAKNVFYQLENNAEEFINSNRGTFEGKKNRLRVSSLYERNKILFPKFDEDLRKHLSYYVDSSYSSMIDDAKSFETNVENMSISDILGGYRDVGGSGNSNSAALQDSINGETPAALKSAGVTGVGALNVGVAAESYLEKNSPYGRFPPDVVKMLKLMEKNGKTRDGTVIIQESEQEK